jgi:hypothetical protein
MELITGCTGMDGKKSWGKNMKKGKIGVGPWNTFSLTL